MSLQTLFVVVEFATMGAFQSFFRVKFVNSGDVFPESGHVSECLVTSITVDIFAIILVNQSVHSQSMSCGQRGTTDIADTGFYFGMHCLNVIFQVVSY